MTYAVALQTVGDQTQALHVLKSKGVNIRPADLAFLSPYATSKLKRFGDYPTDFKPEAMPTCTTLPQWHLVDVAGFDMNLADGPFRPGRKRLLPTWKSRLRQWLNEPIPSIRTSTI